MRKCPVCKQEMKQEFRPFCSDKCKMLDLGSWLDESYAIPALETPYDFDQTLEELDESKFIE